MQKLHTDIAKRLQYTLRVTLLKGHTPKGLSFLIGLGDFRNPFHRAYDNCGISIATLLSYYPAYLSELKIPPSSYCLAQYLSTRA